MTKLILAAAAALTLTACMASTICVQPDPLEPQKKECWNKGINCGEEIAPANK